MYLSNGGQIRTVAVNWVPARSWRWGGRARARALSPDGMSLEKACMLVESLRLWRWIVGGSFCHLELLEMDASIERWNTSGIYI